jgi:hypothetical protein|tara:strand:+ start:33 stop:236 length:204 start_codon:yes stop_codon:yes gene_type:complete
MANPKSIVLPLAQQEYSSADEAVTRRILEQAIQDLAIQLDKVQKLQSVVVSKGLKRHQFLLMGMKHG